MVELRTLWLKFSSPNNDPGGFNFLQSIANSPQGSKQLEPSYVHPTNKQSSASKVSNRSLELCTENLGCETGSYTIKNMFLSLPSKESNGEENREGEQFRPHQFLDTIKNNKRNFPPPLTTMGGSNSLQVRPIREGGRLVIEAVKAPSSYGCFQAERSNGRLKLSLFRDSEKDQTATEYEICENDIEDLENDMDWEKEEIYFEETEDEEEEFEEHGNFEVKHEVFVNGDME